jgi:hypothetical protein
MVMSEPPDQEPTPENRYLKKMRGIIRSHTHQQRINALFVRIKTRLQELEELARDLEEAVEDGIYRFYHGSNKVFFLQSPVKAAFSLIKEIGGEDDPPNFEYARIVEAGTAHQFSETTNANWEAETKPILEAFWHTKYFIKQATRKNGQMAQHDGQVREGAGNGRVAS